MIKKRESYRVVAGSIRSESLRGLSRKICIGALAFSAAVAIIGGNCYSAFADEYYVNGDYDGDEVLVEETADLSDLLQKGGLGTSVTDDGSASLASTYDVAALEERIICGFKEYSASIDVSDLGLLIDDARNGAISDIISAHPEIISVAGYSYSYYPSSGLVATLSVSYSTNAEAEQRELDAAIKKVDSKVDITGMTDEEIVLAYHEYLTSSVAYAYEAYLSNSLGSEHEYDMYGALVNHSVVCQGYAETMFYFLKRAGLPCAIASSKNINHAWNIVKIHGNWYHIDVTWDDPVWDVPGKSLHTYFLVSFDTMNKNTLTNHTKDRTDMIISAQSGDAYTSATDTTYESGKFWNGVEKVIFYNDGYWYSIGEGSSKTNYQINKYKYSTRTNQTLYSGSATWYANDSGRYYVGQFGAIYIQGSILYFTTPDAVNKIDLSASAINATEVVNIRSKYSKGNNIYALGEQEGNLVYAVAASPSLTRTKDSTDSTKYNKDYDEYTIDVCISHAWDAGVVTKTPTYTSTGTKKYTCTNCGETKTETIAKLVCTSHEWDSGVVTKAPTYTSTGTKEYTCVNCGTTKKSSIAMLKLSKVTVKTAVSSTGIKISWTSEKNASGYYIYRKSGKGQYALLKKVTGANTLAFTDTKVTSGVTYTYKVQAYRGNVVGAGTEEGRCFVGTARIKTANASNGVKLAWNKVGGAGSYKIYRKAGTGAYSCIKTVNAAVVTYLDKTAKSGTTYTYLVKPYVGNNVGTYTKSKRLYLKSVTVKARIAGTGVTVSWTKSAGATEYRVYRKISGDKYALVKKVNGTSNLSWNDRSASKGKTYYYYVRAFKGSSYSAASNEMKIKR